MVVFDDIVSLVVYILQLFFSLVENQQRTYLYFHALDVFFGAVCLRVAIELGYSKVNYFLNKKTMWAGISPARIDHFFLPSLL
jgi:hypothetical protein